MKRNILIFVCFLLANSVFSQNLSLPGKSSNATYSQDDGEIIDFSKEYTLKEQVKDIGLEVANQLMRCCSSWGGNNLSAEVDYSSCRLNKVNNSYLIPMTVHWYGSLTGNHYWIKGKLKISTSGAKSWLKIGDSGGFSPGCAGSCL